MTTLYEHALPPIYRYVLARVGQRDLVEDIVAEVFLEMVESITILRAEHEAGFFAWLFGIARTKIARNLQKLARIDALHAPLPDPAADAEANGSEIPTTDMASDPVVWLEWHESIQELGRALESLTPDQQLVVVGRFLAGQSIDELAQALAKQPGTIRALQFRALRTLAKRLAPQRPALDQVKGG